MRLKAFSTEIKPDNISQRRLAQTVTAETKVHKIDVQPPGDLRFVTHVTGRTQIGDVIGIRLWQKDGGRKIGREFIFLPPFFCLLGWFCYEHFIS